MSVPHGRDFRSHLFSDETGWCECGVHSFGFKKRSGSTEAVDVYEMNHYWDDGRMICKCPFKDKCVGCKINEDGSGNDYGGSAYSDVGPDDSLNSGFVLPNGAPIDWTNWKPSDGFKRDDGDGIDWASAMKQAATLNVIAETLSTWLPPAIDRQRRGEILDGPGGFSEFEREYQVRVTENVARLWQDPHLHRRTSQGSEAWLGLRKQFITGSRVGDILDLNAYPNSSRRRVFMDYTDTDPEPFRGNEHTEHGKKYENCAIYAFEQLMRREGGTPVIALPFDFLVSSHTSHYAYSPDFLSNEGVLGEAKCPSLRKIVPGVLPAHYEFGQVQYGLHSLRDFIDDKCHFIEFKPPINENWPDTQILSVSHLRTDADWERQCKWLIDEFWDEVLQYRKDGVMPDHYTSEARYEVWMADRRRGAEPGKYPPSKLTLKRKRDKAVADAAEPRAKKAPPTEGMVFF